MKYPDNFINKIICGDCLEVLKEIPDNCVDAIITDPPAGIEFMGKEWDSFKKNSRSKGWACQGKEGSDGFGGFGKKLRPAFYNQNNQDLFVFQDFIYQVFSEAIRVLKQRTRICKDSRSQIKGYPFSITLMSLYRIIP